MKFSQKIKNKLIKKLGGYTTNPLFTNDKYITFSEKLDIHTLKSALKIPERVYEEIGEEEIKKILIYEMSKEIIPYLNINIKSTLEYNLQPELEIKATLKVIKEGE